MTKFLAVITPAVDTGAIAVDPTLEPYRAAGLTVRNFFLDDGPASVETDADIAACLPGLRRVAQKVAAEGADVIIINCMCDPGLEELRASLETIILGAAQTSMHVAAALAARFSVVDVLTEGRAYVENQVRRYGVTQSYASHRALEIPVLDLYKNPERTLRALEREAHAAIEYDDARILLLGCTGLAELADALNERLQMVGQRCRIIEPLRTTIGVALALINGGISGRCKALESR